MWPMGPLGGRSSASTPPSERLLLALLLRRLLCRCLLLRSCHGSPLVCVAAAHATAAQCRCFGPTCGGGLVRARRHEVRCPRLDTISVPVKKDREVIDEAPRIRRQSVQRPSAAQVDALRGTPTGFLVDALGGSGALDYRIKPAIAEQALCCGVALTCDAGPADNLALVAALEAHCSRAMCWSPPPAATPAARSPATWCWAWHGTAARSASSPTAACATCPASARSACLATASASRPIHRPARARQRGPCGHHSRPSGGQRRRHRLRR